MSRSPDLKYDPPINDPREDGVKHWDTLRTELMTTRDALGFAEIDLKVAREQIAKLEAENVKLAQAREVDQVELITLRTQIQEGAKFFIGILQNGQKARGAAQYAPKASHQKILEGHVEQIEETLRGSPPTFLTKADDTDQQSMQ